MPILTIRHNTRYSYRRPVSFGEHRFMFRPHESFDQRILHERLIITPEPLELRHIQDVFGNCVGIARFSGSARELNFESEVLLEHRPSPLLSEPDNLLGASASTFPFAYGAEDMPDLLRSIERQYLDPGKELERWARQFLLTSGQTGVLAVLASMTHAIHRDFTYAKRLEGGCQAPLETLRTRQGSCRDFAMLMMEAARALGLAARFVSGYIYSRPTAGLERTGAERRGGGHTHAWVRVYLPSCGWVEFDPTNGIIGNTDLVRVAVVREPRQASPLCGSFIGGAADFIDMDVAVEVDVEPDIETRNGPLLRAA